MEGNKECAVEVFSRVTGFFRPVQSWNNGKREEFSDRKKFSFDKVLTEKPAECDCCEDNMTN
ncbi:MAG TPA: anaerobic ribonucleoside-triphosphate reductase [Candidatus Omnitrophota bacterium]|nr:anaerobic ribonucleoside-triphosphate reductase [Candidatus Omnitrophota bacterium]HPS20129.1 anaerobic ribonucleoside-triphosphate reductase [Candidatus Omnitrophota bacterium]